MSKTAKKTFQLPYSPDVVLATLTDPAFLEANFRQQDNPDAKVVVRSRTDDKLIVDCDVTEWVKGMGGIDRGIIEDAILLTDRLEADIRVVQRDTRGPFAEISCVPANRVHRASAVPGAANAREFPRCRGLPSIPSPH